MTTQCTCCDLGAGVIGASIAYFLSRRGVRVTVIERCGVAWAASGKSGGFLGVTAARLQRWHEGAIRARQSAQSRR
jgi:glycine/D-amino acid oxidase-like deaminating enzyme